ncbi:MAG: ankyrin repeat domain-containing protein [Marinicella sp.]|nr:ankyrin repeat domain-containing protein [Xanthomonadales bacterium]
MNQPLSDSAKKILQYCRTGQLDQLQTLLDQGLALEDVNHPDFLPLNTALRNGRWKIAKFLLQNNTIPTKNEHPPLIAATQYRKDITAGMELVFAHTGNLDVINHKGRTALMTACLLGHEKKVRFLLNDCNVLAQEDNGGMTAYLDAVLSQSTGILDILIKQEIDVHHLNHHGDNALLLASLHKNPNIKLVKTLLEQGVDCCHKNKEGKSAFTIAERKHPQVFKLFTAKIEADKQMELPLFVTEPLEEKTNKVDHQIKIKQVKPSNPESEAWFQAVTEGNLGRLNKLRVLGNDINQIDQKGCTALIHAAGRGMRAVASYLIQNGAAIEHRSENGSTAMSSAIISNSRSVVGLLLQHGAKADKTGPGGYPYISLAASQWNESCVTMLLEAGASVDTLDAYGMNLFHHIAMAAEYYSNTAKAKNTMRTVIQFGLDINRTNSQGNTCLHLLCGASTTKNYKADDVQLANIANEMLKSGVNPKIVNHDGFTAIQYAKKHGLQNTKGVILSFLETW